MTKRIGVGESEQKNNKKLKLDDDIESLWGDELDFDAEALDECINLATQSYQEKIACSQQHNVSLLPTYDSFKNRNVVLSSTQLTQFNGSFTEPSTSKNVFIPKKIQPGNSEKELHTLQEQYKEREGEITILRAQLREAKTNIQTEQQKLQSEWKQKLTQTERQVKSVKSELEFKNLEIANLKQKMLEISKHNMLDTSVNVTQNVTTNIIQDNIVVKENNANLKILQPMLHPNYPLRGTLLENIFNAPKREQHFTETKLTQTCRNAIPYFQKQLVSSNMVVDTSDFSIRLVYSDMIQLMNCTEEVLDSKEKINHINKIVCTCEQFLYDLKRFLGRIKENLRTEDILESDSNYLKFQAGSLDSYCEIAEQEEIGVKASVLLNFIAQILLYSEYLQNYVCRDKPLIFQEKDTFREQFPYYIKEQVAQGQYLLNEILIIIRIAGQIRKSNYMWKFLNSTIKLLTSIHKSRNYDYVRDVFCNSTKEIILSRPSVEVICEITYLFKVASQHSTFIEFLLNKSENSISSKKGILYFNENACRFYIFVMLFDNSIFNLKSDKLPFNVCLNLLCFMYNTFKTCHWIHHRNIKECECVPQLYKLVIEIISTALEKYIEETKKEKLLSSEWAHFFKNPITTKVLNLMTFNSYELTEKYITVFSQYKNIEKKLQQEDLVKLEKLDITDEIVEISSDAFKNVDF